MFILFPCLRVSFFLLAVKHHLISVAGLSTKSTVCTDRKEAPLNLSTQGPPLLSILSPKPSQGLQDSGQVTPSDASEGGRWNAPQVCHSNRPFQPPLRSSPLCCSLPHLKVAQAHSLVISSPSWSYQEIKGSNPHPAYLSHTLNKAT